MICAVSPPPPLTLKKIYLSYRNQEKYNAVFKKDVGAEEKSLLLIPVNEWNNDDLLNLFELVYDLGQFTKMVMSLYVVGYSLYTEYNLEKQISILSSTQKLNLGRDHYYLSTLGGSPLKSLESAMKI